MIDFGNEEWYLDLGIEIDIEKQRKYEYQKKKFFCDI